MKSAQKVKNEKLKVKKESDIRIRTYSFSLLIIKIIDNLPRNNSCLVLGKQLLRSATSIGANVIEAQAGSSRKDFMLIALKSANETKYWIGLIRDSQNIDTTDLKLALDEVQQISKILGSIIVKLRKNKT